MGPVPDRSRPGRRGKHRARRPRGSARSARFGAARAGMRSPPVFPKRLGRSALLAVLVPGHGIAHLSDQKLQLRHKVG